MFPSEVSNVPAADINNLLNCTLLPHGVNNHPIIIFKINHLVSLLDGDVPEINLVVTTPHREPSSVKYFN